MRKRRAYRAAAVKNVLIERVLESAPDGPVCVGLDVGKKEIFAVVRWADGTFERPWKAKNPSEIRVTVRLLRELADRGVLTVALESTGTYGDAMRQAMTDAELNVHRVSGKAAHDYAEIFDGVPSKHDGKDAAVVAELAAIGKSWPWEFKSKEDNDAEMARRVDWLDAQQSIKMLWLGRMEALLARFWPEATTLLGLTSITLLKTLARYGGPKKLSEDPAAAERLAGWGGPMLKPEKIEALLESARETVGVRQCDQDIQRTQQYATAALEAQREIQNTTRRLKELAKNNATIQRQAEVVGTVTSCVLWVALGDPHDYHCGEAYRKGMGLNLMERSSGKHKGELSITKRGPGIARRWLYFAAMRMAQVPEVRPWYEAKKAKDGDRGKGALIAIMRKLATALYNVGARDEEFEAWRLFPGRSVASKNLRAQNEAAACAM